MCVIACVVQFVTRCSYVPYIRRNTTDAITYRFISKVFRLLTDFVCLYNYEFGLSLCKIVRSSVILLLPLFSILTPLFSVQ